MKSAPLETMQLLCVLLPLAHVYPQGPWGFHSSYEKSVRNQVSSSNTSTSLPGNKDGIQLDLMNHSV